MGKLTRAVDGLRSLSEKMKEHSGVDTTLWDEWFSVFVKYKTLVASVLTSIAVFSAILVLCGCCCIPCLRALIIRLIITVVTPTPQPQLIYHLLPSDDLPPPSPPFSNVPDLFPNISSSSDSEDEDIV